MSYKTTFKVYVKTDGNVYMGFVALKCVDYIFLKGVVNVFFCGLIRCRSPPTINLSFKDLN